MNSSETRLLKQRVRQLMQRRRAAIPDRKLRSRQIIERLVQLPEYASAETILFYVSVRNEVDTQAALDEALAAGRRVAVPYCEQGELRLVRLFDRKELELGAHNIPEPLMAVRDDPDRQVPPETVDFAVIPGVSFDTLGYRLGHGAGYYDNLLARLRPGAVLAGLSFECQIVDELPIEPHDMGLHYVVTETTVYVGQR
jgi:5-formyltetrahydrofolate cyclo-ligase